MQLPQITTEAFVLQIRNARKQVLELTDEDNLMISRRTNNDVVLSLGAPSPYSDVQTVPDVKYPDLLRVSVLNSTPHTIIHEEDLAPKPTFGRDHLGRRVKQTEVLKATGLDMEVLEALAQSLNFSYRLYLGADGKWGALESANAFNGMIGEVQSGLTDMAITEITITSTRSMYIQYTFPYNFDALQYVTKFKPNSRTLSTNLAYNWMFTFFDALLMLTQVLAMQSLWRLPFGTAGRLVLGICLFCSIIIATGIGGTLVSLFSTNTIEETNLNSPQQLQEAIAKGTFKAATVSDSAISTLFESATLESLYGQIFKGFADFNISDPQTGLQLVEDTMHMSHVDWFTFSEGFGFTPSESQIQISPRITVITMQFIVASSFHVLSTILHPYEKL
ncbi:unnamed protein product [Cyprideis torosa]|uniref:Uncharacterized protein n=1 Tax=Cyprideis torosa TaxID=163714 RepID=A0A7R8ZMI2_9CRUS|nr:unnamed protein product [Cyprideis torosa]CAG0894255.1 unnamed protein product [Cyprideis torosa]